MAHYVFKFEPLIHSAAQWSSGHEDLELHCSFILVDMISSHSTTDIFPPSLQFLLLSVVSLLPDPPLLCTVGLKTLESFPSVSSLSLHIMMSSANIIIIIRSSLTDANAAGNLLFTMSF